MKVHGKDALAAYDSEDSEEEVASSSSPTSVLPTSSAHTSLDQLTGPAGLSSAPTQHNGLTGGGGAGEWYCHAQSLASLPTPPSDHASSPTPQQHLHHHSTHHHHLPAPPPLEQHGVIHGGVKFEAQHHTVLGQSPGGLYH